MVFVNSDLLQGLSNGNKTYLVEESQVSRHFAIALLQAGVVAKFQHIVLFRENCLDFLPVDEPSELALRVEHVGTVNICLGSGLFWR